MIRGSRWPGRRGGGRRAARVPRRGLALRSGGGGLAERHVTCYKRRFVWLAGVAQLAEQLICNQPVGGSNPFASSTKRPEHCGLSIGTGRKHPRQTRRAGLAGMARRAKSARGPSRYREIEERLSADVPWRPKGRCTRGQGVRARLPRRRPGAAAGDGTRARGAHEATRGRGEVAERSNAADCKSVALAASEVRILPSPPAFACGGHDRTRALAAGA
jgi:hypothetical protein